MQRITRPEQNTIQTTSSLCLSGRMSDRSGHSLGGEMRARHSGQLSAKQVAIWASVTIRCARRLAGLGWPPGTALSLRAGPGTLFSLWCLSQAQHSQDGEGCTGSTPGKAKAGTWQRYHIHVHSVRHGTSEASRQSTRQKELPLSVRITSSKSCLCYNSHPLTHLEAPSLSLLSGVALLLRP